MDQQPLSESGRNSLGMSKKFKKFEKPPNLTAEDYINAHPGTPTIDGIPVVVDYSTRSPRSFIISGPLGPPRRGGVGPDSKGRRFGTPAQALRWAEGFYVTGTRLELVKPPVPALNPCLEGEDDSIILRWAILVTPND
jgi:hypothetical protein